MPAIRISKEEKDQYYFVTPTIRLWYYILDRHNRWEILADSLRFLVQEKALSIHGYVFMLNHLHLIVQSQDVSGFLRDFKSFTARELRKNIEQTEPGLLQLFRTESGTYEFWKRTNMPEPLVSETFYFQKMNYIHNNPVKKQYVRKPEDWYWSSALTYETGESGPLPLRRLDDMMMP